MNQYVRRLFNDAVLEHRTDGVVSSDTQMRLAAEGYDLAQLDRDIDRVNARH
ncbi:MULTISPECIES: hypothetical protein [unclassified Caulobacter]|uniref:hypothetical protein n=1 Tax=unclassified Caulobacter TaxID=2648921 RepID=UPI001304C47D|nr:MULTISPECIES: hypothetical protein [unclassified Caulobacter]